MVAKPQIHNVNVADQRVLISPAELRDMIEIPESIYDFLSASRTTIERIIDRQDHRLMVVVQHGSLTTCIRSCAFTLRSRGQPLVGRV